MPVQASPVAKALRQVRAQWGNGWSRLTKEQQRAYVALVILDDIAPKLTVHQLINVLAEFRKEK
jgi:hypothetical protein